MPEEQETQDPQETPEEPTEDPKAAEPEADPYAEYDEDQRDLIKAYDQKVQSMSPYERALVYEMAVEFQKEKAKPKAEPKPEPKDEGKKKAAKDDDADDPVRTLAEEVRSLRAELEQEKRTKAEKQQMAEFDAKLNSVLDGDEDIDDEGVREFIKEGYLGHYLKHKPADVKGSFKRWLAQHKQAVEKAAEKKQKSYVKGKLATAFRTKGESGGATPPAREEANVTAENFERGDIAAKLKEEFGLV